MPTNWNKFCKTLKTYHNKNSAALDITEEKFNAMMGAINNITVKIMNDDIVQKSLQSVSLLRKNLIDKNCSMIATEFSHYLKQGIINLDKLVQEQPNVRNMYKCIKINSLFVLSSQLFGNVDKKIFKSLVELNTKVGVNFIYSNCNFCNIYTWHRQRAS